MRRFRAKRKQWNKHSKPRCFDQWLLLFHSYQKLSFLAPRLNVEPIIATKVITPEPFTIYVAVDAPPIEMDGKKVLFGTITGER